MKINQTNIPVLLAALVGMLLAQCTPIDYHFRDYLDNAEKAYPGRVDSMLFMPGNNRAAIRALISTDPRVERMRITWGQDGYYETDIAPEDIAGYKQIVIQEIAESIYTFDIRTIDREGNQSIRAELFGRVYGAEYVANLNNRIIDNVRESEDGLIINWFPESVDSTLLGTVVSYQTSAGDTEEVFTAATLNQTLLPRFSGGTTFDFNTLFKPDSLAIDTFFAVRQTIDPADYLVAERTLYASDNWSVAGLSSENNSDRHAAANLIDGTSETFWIARFSDPATDYPDHWVTIDMAEVLSVDGFFFAQKNGDRKVKELEILISDDNETWESLGLFGLANTDREYQYIELENRVSFRYFKIVPTAGHDSQRQPGLAEAGTFYY